MRGSFAYRHYFYFLCYVLKFPGSVRATQLKTASQPLQVVYRSTEARLARIGSLSNRNIPLFNSNAMSTAVTVLQNRGVLKDIKCISSVRKAHRSGSV